MPGKKEVFEKLITRLHLLLQLSGKSYQNYLRNKIFVHAEALRVSNKRIIRLLLEHASLIPDELEDACLHLLNHYDCWLVQFRIHRKKTKPAAADIFVFEQADEQCAFPREAEQQVNQYYLKLKQELENDVMVTP